MLDDVDTRSVEHAGHERSLDLGAGRVAAGVRDAIAVMATLAGEREPTVVAAVEARTELDEIAHRCRTLANEQADRRLIAHPRAGDDGVVEVLLWGCHPPLARPRCRPAPSA